MPFKIFLVEAAERDIDEVWRYVDEHDSPAKAERVIEALEDACRSLATLPERGNTPKELRGLAIDDFREIHSGRYRIIHRVIGRRVIVYCVLDGRRDMQSLLYRRLVR